MKQIMIICVFFAFTSICEGQILKDSLYTATPAEREMYRNAIKKGRGQKALGSLVIVGGAALSTVGVRIALEGIREIIDEDDIYTDELLWKGGTTIFIIGLGTIAYGTEMIKNGRQKVREGKVCLKLTSESIGLVINF